MENKTTEILREVKKVIIGKDEIIQRVLIAFLSGGHVLLEDVPGVGKTTLALAFRKVLGLDYRRIQLTSDSVPSDILGFSVYNKDTGNFDYKQGAIMTNLFLADEINRTSSKTQSALLEAMEEGQVTIDGISHSLPKPFLVIATQNPVGSAGTQILPSSQLDRFMVRLHMGYPDATSEINILKDRHMDNPLNQVTQIVEKSQIIALQEAAGNVHLSDAIYEYISSLAHATRHHKLITLGLSTRGALALCRMTKSNAFVQGRDYVVPEDVNAVFQDVCAHRMVLSPKAKIADTSAEVILQEICQSIEIPTAI